MAILVKNVHLDQVPATNTTLYTCPENTVARIIKATVTNDTTTAQTLSMHKVESGGSVADNRIILNLRSIGSQETYEMPEIVGQVLAAEMFLNGIAGGADQLTLNLDVTETPQSET